MSYLSVSTWSLHRMLGPLRWTYWDAGSRSIRVHVEEQPELLTLLELPAEAARRGYGAIEICHFHFPSTETAYLFELREAFRRAGVSFDTLLLDYGDLTSEDAERVEADMSLMREWIEVASAAGAKRIRLIAGEADPDDDEAIKLAAKRLSELHEYAAAMGVSVVTENFKNLASTGESCLVLMLCSDFKVKMISDFGNFEPKNREVELALTIRHSVSVHAKADCDEYGNPDAAAFERCLDVMRRLHYDGAVVLIYDGPGDMWEGLERVKRLAVPYLQPRWAAGHEAASLPG